MMRVLVDINHPAHVHFFRNPIALLQQRGHEVLVTSRQKDVTLALLDEYRIPHRTLSMQVGSGAFALLRELLERDRALLRVVREFRPHVMAAIGGTFIAHAGALARLPRVAFYDTQNATLQNAITYPLLSALHVPRCYDAWVPSKRTTRYAGYHELSYLHPAYFRPDRDIALHNGLAAEGDTFLLRLVSWRASHDLADRGWDGALLRDTLDHLSARGRVLISSEGGLPPDLERYAYRGEVGKLHHVMAYCRLVVGESATVASESAILGVPAIYAARTRRCYTDELEARYGLIRNVETLEFASLCEALESMLALDRSHWATARDRLLDDTIDVAIHVADTIEATGTPLRGLATGPA